jgi:hypothetical protein
MDLIEISSLERRIDAIDLTPRVMAPGLFDHLPSAFRLPQEAYQVPHSTYEAEDRIDVREGEARRRI